MTDHNTPRIAGQYGDGPTTIAEIDLSDQWHEFMHYMYLPVRLPEPGVYGGKLIKLPTRLRFLADAVDLAVNDAAEFAPHLADPYVYVTARRGYATPDNPLNRPGYHCDDFGGTDLNYVWTDRYPTQYLLSSEPLTISADDDQSMEDMEDHAARANRLVAGVPTGVRRVDGPLNTLSRLTPYVIHDTPTILDGGGVRSFFKISVSTHRYDLLGNSHNHAFNYDWPMTDREALRNQPSGANADYTQGS